MYDSDRPWWRRWLLRPVTVTVLVLFAAVVITFAWTTDYVDSAVSSATATQSTTTPTTSPSTIGSTPASPVAQAAALLPRVRGAVWAVSTLDTNGDPTTGTAVAVISTPTQTLLLTTYSLVAASIYQPAPGIEVSGAGGIQVSATLRTWDTANDLALLVVDSGGEPVLVGAGTTAPSPGQQVFAVSSTGGAAATISPQKVVDGSTLILSGGSAPALPPGAPVVDVNGSVLGVSSPGYTPPSAIALPAGDSYAVPIAAACAIVLMCPGGTFPSS